MLESAVFLISTKFQDNSTYQEASKPKLRQHRSPQSSGNRQRAPRPAGFAHGGSDPSFTIDTSDDDSGWKERFRYHLQTGNNYIFNTKIFTGILRKSCQIWQQQTGLTVFKRLSFNEGKPYTSEILEYRRKLLEGSNFFLYYDFTLTSFGEMRT